MLCLCVRAGNNKPAGAASGSGKGEAIAMTSPVRMEIQEEGKKKKGESIAMT